MLDARKVLLGAGIVAGGLGLAWLAMPPRADPAAEARLAELRSALETDPLPAPHPVRPSGEPLRCQTGIAAAEALRDFPEVTPEERAALAAFSDDPSKETAEEAFPVLQRILPGLQKLLDSAWCSHVAEVPPGFAGRLAGVTPFVGVQARALAWSGDLAGAARWALDLMAVGHDFRKYGGFAEYDAGGIAQAEAMGILGPVLVSPDVPKGLARQVVDELGALLDHTDPPAAALERERQRVRAELMARVAPAHEILEDVDTYDARMNQLADAFREPPERRAAALQAWKEAEPTLIDPAELDQDAVDLYIRGRGLLTVAALVHWRETNAECPMTLDAVRAGLPKDATRHLGEEGVEYSASPCYVAAVRPNGSTVDAWGIP